jgi:CheY-like chemotaxis protein
VRYAEAVNGKHALDILEKEKHDLVLMDLDMPEMNGFELLANGDEEFLELGFSGFLPKPFEPEKFLDILRRQLV